MNTLLLNAREIKEHLKEQANEEGRDLSSPENRFTLWSGSRNAGFSYEGHAEHDYQIASKLGAVTLKNKTRAAILDNRENRVLVFGCEIA
jgi:hypothetical protein